MALNTSQSAGARDAGVIPLRAKRPAFGKPVPTATLSDAGDTPDARYTAFLSKQLKVPAAFVFAKGDLIGRAAIKLVDAEAEAEDGAKALAKELSRHVLEMGHQLVVSDTNSHPLLTDLGKSPSFAAFLGQPILDRHKAVVGVICVADHKMRSWTDVEVFFLSVIAEEIGAKLG